MTTNLYPRLSPEMALNRRLELQKVKDPTRAFSEEFLDEALLSPDAFPPSGGRRVDGEHLMDLRQRCFDAIDNSGTIKTEEFDLAVGRTLHEASISAGNDFGNPGVWDFLTLALMPDLALIRCPVDAKDFTSRMKGGHRRHVFQRLWRRWNVLGPDFVQSGVLGEDEYKNLLERKVTGGSKILAQQAAQAIIDSGHRGTARRDYSRTMMRQLVQLSGLVDVCEEEPEHLSALFEEIRTRTITMLDEKEVLCEDEPRPADDLPD